MSTNNDNQQAGPLIPTPPAGYILPYQPDGNAPMNDSNRKLLYRIAGIAIAIIVIFIGYRVLNPPASAILDAEVLKRGPATGAPVSWQIQLVTAQAEAAKINPNAILIEVQAEPVARTPAKLENNLAFHVEFLFTSTESNAETLTDQNYFHLALNDTDPQNTLVKPSMGFYPLNRMKPSLEEYKTALATVKIGPRDVYLKTKDEASALLSAKADGYLITSHLLMRRAAQAEDDPKLPAYWVIEYFAHEKVGNGTSSYYWVDPQSGNILKHAVKSWDDGATPAPLTREP